ncbi:MAG TPA: GNAT family N-acetyltransferase [Candidatus Dorea intestinavium]|nr:GNAT family N-acetyltransferase [Candidatus Dorea intestinavium]
MIRKVRPDEKKLYVSLAMEFYDSPKFTCSIPEHYVNNAWDEIMREDSYLSAYIIEETKKPVGFALLSTTFSQRAGGKVVWIEELYVKEEYRGRGLASEFLGFIKDKIEPQTAQIRVELEPNNEYAKEMYTSIGYEEKPVIRMKKE